MLLAPKRLTAIVLKLVSHTGCNRANWFKSLLQPFHTILRPLLADSAQSLETGRELRDPCWACLAGPDVCLLPAHRCPASLYPQFKRLQEATAAKEPCKSRGDRLQQLVDDALGPLAAKEPD